MLVAVAALSHVGTAPGSGIPPCRAAQLHASLELQGATGHLVGSLRVENRGPACALRGRPGVALRAADGRAIRFRASAGRPWWHFGSGPAPRSWPTLRLRPRAQAFASVQLTNWCGPNGQRVRFAFALPAAGGTVATYARIRLRCESAASAVFVLVGPFEPPPSR